MLSHACHSMLYARGGHGPSGATGVIAAWTGRLGANGITRRDGPLITVNYYAPTERSHDVSFRIFNQKELKNKKEQSFKSYKGVGCEHHKVL